MCALANIKMRKCAHMSLRGGEAEGMRAVRALRLDICSDDHVNKKKGKNGHLSARFPLLVGIETERIYCFAVFISRVLVCAWSSLSSR